MKRQEAISNIVWAFDVVGHERCIGDTQRQENARELRDSLRALGVADAEMPEALLQLPSDA
jgi:hypothetical protein